MSVVNHLANAVALCTIFAAPGFCANPRCEDLTGLTIPETTMQSAVHETSAGGKPVDFCRVKVVSRPLQDSEIHIEVWLPEPDKWNGKFLGTGNGGYSGDPGYGAMRTALEQGYATAGSDTGHSGGDLSFGAGHPEKINDWGYRAVHVMTGTAALIARNYYGRFADHSYFSGCSTGGQQALTEAQRYPADYDGIVAGDPGNNRVRLNAGFLWSWRATHDGATPFPASKLPMLNKAVIAACDRLDGVEDGLISEPRRCMFDPGTLLCKGSDDAGCLTAPEVSAVRKVYDGAHNPRTGERVFAGWERGSEAGWGGYFVGHPEPARVDFWRLWVFDNRAWDSSTFDFDRDVAYSDTKMAAVTANDPDLGAFRQLGHKLVIYQGWADPVVPPEDTLRYYDSVGQAFGGISSVREFARLFMVPGMGHCGGGPGPNVFDSIGALDAWVTKNIAPDQLMASHVTNGKADRVRPVCPYPAVARPQSGSGNPDAVFTCVSDSGVRPAK